MGAIDFLKHAWNAFSAPSGGDENDLAKSLRYDYGGFSSANPARTRTSLANERSIVTAIYNRLAVDISAIAIRHVKLDDNGRYVQDVVSAMNECFSLKANIDQGARAFRQDVAMTLFERGAVAIVPVDTTFDPNQTAAFDIQTMRVGHVVKWFPRHVRVSVYDDRPGMGKRREITLEKKYVAVFENPFYAVMNEPNSTLQRLIRKLNLLDVIDEQSSSGKLDLIIQLPYVIKTEARKQQALIRKKDLEDQLRNSQHGIAYTDGTEKITQLNRPVENNLMNQIEYLIKLLYSQLGLTEEIMNGTADEKTMLNYQNRTLEPVLDAYVEAMTSTFLTKTARTQGHAILYWRDPFKLVPISQIAEIADKFSRNKILTSNEIRQAIGYKPSDDPSADKLENSNMPAEDNTPPAPSGPATPTDPTQEGDSQNGS